MKLEYEQIEDLFDETTHIRTMTEQALIPGHGMLIRTTVYTPHHIAVDVTFVPGSGKKKESFEPVTA